jgi:hypothetical protein
MQTANRILALTLLFLCVIPNVKAQNNLFQVLPGTNTISLVDPNINVGIGVNSNAWRFQVGPNNPNHWGGMLIKDNIANPTVLRLGTFKNFGGKGVISCSKDETSGVPGTLLFNPEGGAVCIGTWIEEEFSNQDYRLYVYKGIRTEKVRVDYRSNWADYVFAPNYKLRPLLEVEAFIKKNQHLPDVPSAKEIHEKGIDLGEMHKIQMQKIEELTLYLLEIKKENDSFKKENDALKKRLEALESNLKK